MLHAARAFGNQERLGRWIQRATRRTTAANISVRFRKRARRANRGSAIAARECSRNRGMRRAHRRFRQFRRRRIRWAGGQRQRHAVKKNPEFAAVNRTVRRLAIGRNQRSHTFRAKKLHDLPGGVGHPREQTQYPESQRDKSDDQRRHRFAGAGETRIQRDHFSCLERFIDRDRFQNYPEAKNSNDRVFQCLACLLAGDRRLLHDHRRAAFEGHYFAIAAILLPVHRDETI